jgi:hypothetical protein
MEKKENEAKLFTTLLVKEIKTQYFNLYIVCFAVCFLKVRENKSKLFYCSVVHRKTNTVHWVSSSIFLCSSSCFGTYVTSSGSVFVLVSM